MKSKVITLSAISASFIAVLLTLGAYISVVDIIAVVFSSVFVLLPIYYKSYMGAICAFLAGGVLAFIISGFNLLSIVFVAYFGFFGIFPIIKNIMIDKKFNKILGFIINLVWFVAFAYGIYFYYTLFMNIQLDSLPDWISNSILWFVALVAVVFYIIYDRFIVVSRIFLDRYLKRIIKK